MRRFCRIFNQKEMFRRLSELSPAALELYGFILQECDWRLGRYVSSSAEIGNQIGLSERSIQRANRELNESGLMKVKRGIYAINPEFSWGGRSWNMPKASFYTMGSKSAKVIDFADAAQSVTLKQGNKESEGCLKFNRKQSRLLR